MPDPFSVIFLPGGTAAALVLFVGPLILLRQFLWRREARRRNARLRCARCEAPLAIDDLFLFHGAHVCGQCATTLRRRFRIAIPVALVAAATFAVSSFSAFGYLLGSGRTGLDWWLDGRWIPLLLPSAGLAAATLLFLKLGRRANRLRDAGPWGELAAAEIQESDLFSRRITTLAADGRASEAAAGPPLHGLGQGVCGGPAAASYLNGHC